ncbi:ABC transporter permease [Aliikangiella maris]|uniref:FtsX-like permease family protein n=2 Tax=Aliikangiella maris TaxID=3162458 RepID=A0ABV2BU90_9GAMM
MLLKLAIRNTLRYRLRLLLSTLVVVIASLALVSSIGTIIGTKQTLQDSVINTLTGDIIIKPKDSPVDFFKFTSSRRLPVIESAMVEQVISKLNSEPSVEAASSRIRFGSLIGNNQKSVPAMVMGVDLTAEPKVTTDTQTIIQPILDNLSSEINQSVLSDYILGRLNLAHGDEVILFTETPDESFNAMNFNLAGSIATPVLIDEYVKQAFYIDIKAARELLYLDQSAATEIVIRMSGDAHNDLPSAKAKIQALLSDEQQRHLGVYTYNEVEKSIEGISAIAIGIGAINIGVIFLIMIVTIMIVTTMTLHERRFEIGTLISLGMSPKSLTQLFMLEVILKIVIGYTVGFILAILNLTRINESGGYQATNMLEQYWYGGKVMFPVVDYRIVLLGFVIILFVALLSTIRSCSKAGKQDAVALLSHQ